MTIITSRDNKIFKLAQKLKTARGRAEEELFLIEGLRSVKDAHEKGAHFHSLILRDGEKMAFEVQCPVWFFAKRLFEEISETVTPQGIIALCHMKKSSMQDIINEGKKCVIMCEALQDPGNIGTIIRSAHAAFSGGVILTKGCCDLYNPKIIRATMSGVFSVPVVQGVSSKEALQFFASHGYTSVCGALCESATDIFDTDLKGKHLIIIGNEGNGISEETINLCDKKVIIPMERDAESLNAAVAGTVMMYEHYRQNRK